MQLDVEIWDWDPLLLHDEVSLAQNPKLFLMAVLCQHIYIGSGYQS